MRITITGANGQLGGALIASLAPQHTITALGHVDLELSDPAATATIVATHADLVIHAGAYTNVDGCARDPDLAYRVNGLGTRYVALACRTLGAPLVYISTNEVFDGADARFYREYDPTGAVNAYGASKLIGEQAVRELVPQHYIARVAWLYGGERNFVRTVLRLAAERPSLAMVTDEIGSPTATHDVAAAVSELITQPQYGTYHLVNSGHVSRHDFAAEILRQRGITSCTLGHTTLAEYKRASRVPPHTPLRNIAAADLGIVLRPWQDALAAYLERTSAA